MKRLFGLIFILTFSVVAIANTDSVYSGLEKNEIKSLSKNEISGYLNGKGMGFAKVAELNHYPGPRHVLDLSHDLQLSEQQIEDTRHIYQDMKSKAKEYGALLIEKEREIEGLFLTEKTDSMRLQKLTRESAEITAQIRLAHLEAHVLQKKLLTEGQIKKYDEIRGYNRNNRNEHSHHH